MPIKSDRTDVEDPSRGTEGPSRVAEGGSRDTGRGSLASERSSRATDGLSRSTDGLSLGTDGLSRGAALFRGLADRTRLAILAELALAERRVVDLTGALGLAQGTISGHLACLRGCGLIVARPQGRQMFYSLAHPELLDLLRAAEELLELTGEAVRLCPWSGDASAEGVR
jgi:ArsR family transcriptional regulator, cadmium/lead-responsive transcriptional repressor